MHSFDDFPQVSKREENKIPRNALLKLHFNLIENLCFKVSFEMRQGVAKALNGNDISNVEFENVKKFWKCQIYLCTHLTAHPHSLGLHRSPPQVVIAK
jgi:hypothetical protein